MFPMLILMPLVVSKTKNTWTSIIIHTLIGAPAQVMIILGAAESFSAAYYLELIFKINNVDSTSTKPATSIMRKVVPRKTAASTVAATGSTLESSPAYTEPTLFSEDR